MLGEFVTDEDRGILFSTHITADLEKIADYITFILDGKIIYSGPKEELLEKYMTVKGGPDDLDDGQKKLIIGLREHYTGFEGIAETDDLGGLPKNLLAMPVTLDEIIVAMNGDIKKGSENR
jgi:ABC-2 type transport system ATP-binding protein